MDGLASTLPGILGKGLRIGRTIKNASERWKEFRFRKEEQDLNVLLQWYRLKEEKLSSKVHAGGGLDPERLGRRDLDMTPSFFFLDMERRWPNSRSQKKTGLVIEERH